MKKQCGFCGKDVDRIPSQIKRSKTENIYCNRSCATSQNNKLFKRDENNPNYTTGQGSYRVRKMRDVCQCEDCSNNDIRVLEVHHKDKNRQNNKLSNLSVLCANCHKIRHRIKIN